MRGCFQAPRASSEQKGILNTYVTHYDLNENYKEKDDYSFIMQPKLKYGKTVLVYISSDMNHYFLELEEDLRKG